MSNPEANDFDRMFITVEQDEATGLYFFVLADDEHAEPLMQSWGTWATEAEAFAQAKKLAAVLRYDNRPQEYLPERFQYVRAVSLDPDAFVWPGENEMPENPEVDDEQQ